MPVLTVGSKRILYIHIPKTGGTTVENLLRSYNGNLSMYSPSRGALPCSPQHFHRELLEKVLGSPTTNGKGYDHDFDFVFMTVRHPETRLLSEYRYQRSISVRLKINPIAHSLPFDAWCRYVLWHTARNPLYSDNHVRPQVDFAVWDPVIYRLEDGLDEVQERLDSIIGAQGKWPAQPLKVSTNSAGNPGRLRASTRSLIRSFFSRDFDAFDYSAR